MSIDSTFRPNNVPALKSVPYTSEGIWNASHFTADLTDPLTRVLSLQLYSVQIPYTWYNISQGSNCFSYEDQVYSITPGNYNINTLKEAIDNLAIPNLTFVIDNYSKRYRLSPVVFDHWLHRAKFTCRLCHVDIGFAMKANETGIRAVDNTVAGSFWHSNADAILYR